MGLLKKILTKRTLKSVLKGVADIIPFVNTIKDNVKSEESGKGKVDWARFFTFLAMLISVIALIVKWIDKDTFTTIIDTIK